MFRFQNFTAASMGLLFTAVIAAPAVAQENADLTHGRVEVRGFGGINFGTDRGSLAPKTPASFGGEIAAGLHRDIALTGHYAHNDIGSYKPVVCFYGSGCSRPEAGGAYHELMGGIRLSAANSSRVTPYATFSAGMARLQASSSVGNLLGIKTSLSAGVNKFALAPGGGLDFKLTRNMGIDFDVRAVRPFGMKWYFRPSLGVFARFGKG